MCSARQHSNQRRRCNVCVVQMQGVKSTQWVAKDADKALELLSGGAAGHLISMLSDQTQPGEHGEG